ncbi:MAG: hypothetical protein ACOYBH_02080 [Candidatus Alectryocaccobium sp.]
MLCENCPALRIEGYEYPETYCLIQPEENTYEFSKGCGCYLRPSTIQKRIQYEEEAFSHAYDGVGEWYVLTEEIENNSGMREQCIFVMKKCLSINKDSRFYKRHGKVFFAPKQNSIKVTRSQEEYAALKKLSFCGLMVCDKADDTPFWKKADMEEVLTYSVTEKGKRWISDILKINIK